MQTNIVAIPVRKYWEIINNICDNTPETDWYRCSETELEEKFLGLRFINNNYDKFKNERYLCKFFKVINKEKWLWTKLKYDI
jgi:hypothetical protein